jgi:ankyrin repeat protein
MDYIEFFLDNNYDVNYVDPLVKRTALMYAAIGDQTEVFKLLLSKGADPRIRNDKSVDAVEFSPRFKHCEYEALVDLYAWEQYKTKAK